eukprot:CAMPEP_0185695414 /NCGR_PEP_ID=MMETSP1164-20130828/4512_1 /TAXON_ID=1104430 /ORGANISM="Chrysoreinhardia sp, Strain CCMP2950" /LENGTH=168 /DNA_ID=CAMNT_0028362275 /DNA_START=1106 /DNA_END=1614 /DNA_ORIENTATION=+
MPTKGLPQLSMPRMWYDVSDCQFGACPCLTSHDMTWSIFRFFKAETGMTIQGFSDSSRGSVPLSALVRKRADGGLSCLQVPATVSRQARDLREDDEAPSVKRKSIIGMSINNKNYDITTTGVSSPLHVASAAGKRLHYLMREALAHLRPILCLSSNVPALHLNTPLSH